MSNTPKNFQDAMVELVATLKSLEKYSRSASVANSARERLKEIIKVGDKPVPPAEDQIKEYLNFMRVGKK